jgi:hypothetical protein
MEKAYHDEDGEVLVTMDKAAVRLGLSYPGLRYRLASAGQAAPKLIKIGRRKFVRESDLMTFADNYIVG